jgi:hypothetical protein
MYGPCSPVGNQLESALLPYNTHGAMNSPHHATNVIPASHRSQPLRSIVPLVCNSTKTKVATGPNRARKAVRPRASPKVGVLHIPYKTQVYENQQPLGID